MKLTLAAIVIALSTGCAVAVDIPPGTGWWCVPAGAEAIDVGACQRARNDGASFTRPVTTAWCFGAHGHTTADGDADITQCFDSASDCESDRATLGASGWVTSACVASE